ncbi:MAG: hypothetical protein WCV68_03435 [Candidatus Paceibacterota bacterium]|jgi:hypothetical protein
MVSILEFKKTLGDYADELTDQEIERLKQIEEQLADILIEHVLRENSTPAMVISASSPSELSIFANN